MLKHRKPTVFDGEKFAMVLAAMIDGEISICPETISLAVISSLSISDINLHLLAGLGNDPKEMFERMLDMGATKGEVGGIQTLLAICGGALDRATILCALTAQDAAERGKFLAGYENVEDFKNYMENKNK